MVKTTLVGADIEHGGELLSRIEERDKTSRQGFRIQAAFWLRENESLAWTLVIASPLIDEIGPLRAYRAVQTVVRPMKLEDFTLEDVSVVSPGDPLVRAIRKVRFLPGSTGMKLGPGTIGREFVEGVYIYRLRSKAKKQKKAS